MKNVGSLDRILRIVVGLALLAIALVPQLSGLSGVASLGAWKTALGIVGAIMILTGLIRFCPAYLPFGINTCSKG